MSFGASGAGGSGSSSGNASVYLPPGQAGAATAFGNVLTPWANQSANTIGQLGGYDANPYGGAYQSTQAGLPYASNLVQQYLTGNGTGGTSFDTYLADALTQAQNTLGYGQSTLFPNAISGSNSLFQQGQTTLGESQDLYNQNNSLAQGLWNQNMGLADTVYNQSAALAPQFLAQGMAPAQQALSQAFDPQQTLYNQQQGQALDSASVANAIAGTSGSPYGASNTANALNNFNTGWQSNLLGREQTGAGTYSNLANTALGGYEGLQNLGISGYNALSQGGVSDYNSLTQGGVSDLTSLLAGGTGALNYSNQIGTQGANTINQLALDPYQTGSTIASGGLSGLSGLSNLTGTSAGYGQSAYQLPQQVLSDLESYLGLGQSASQLNANIGQMGFNQTASALGGGLAGINSLFGNNSLLGGSSGLFGSSGALGGLSSLFGGGSAGIGDELALDFAAF